MLGLFYSMLINGVHEKIDTDMLWRSNFQTSFGQVSHFNRPTVAQNTLPFSMSIIRSRPTATKIHRQVQTCVLFFFKTQPRAMFLHIQYLSLRIINAQNIPPLHTQCFIECANVCNNWHTSIPGVGVTKAPFVKFSKQHFWTCKINRYIFCITFIFDRCHRIKVIFNRWRVFSWCWKIREITESRKLT